MKFCGARAKIQHYIRELAHRPVKFIHHPFKAPAGVLEAAGVELGTIDPRSIVDPTPAHL